MCPRSGPGGWMEADMAMEDFLRIAPGFRDVENVVLEGWGEPLLYRGLFECIRLVKEAGAAAGFVTSGRPLDEDCITRALDSGLDFIGFSFAGATATTHEGIRRGSDFRELTEGIRQLCRKKEERALTSPRIHLVYLMMKDNMDELPVFMDLAGRVGAREVILLNQVLVADFRQERQRVFAPPEAARYEAILKETAIRAARLGIRLHRPSLFPGEVVLCNENPLRNLYISVTGDVSPCVYLNPPVEPPSLPGTEYGASLLRVSFGNIFRQPFRDIWDGEDYRRFRSAFQERVRTLDEIHARLGGMGVDFPSTARILAEAPGPCAGCIKLMGG